MKRKQAALVIGGVSFFLTQPVIFFLKHGFLDEMDFWIGTFGLVVFAIIEVILFIWVFGSKNAWREIGMGADIRVPKFFYPIMKYVTPTYLFLLLGFWFFQEGIHVVLMRGVSSGDFPYVWFARFLMLGILFATLVLVKIAWQRRHLIQQRVPA